MKLTGIFILLFLSQVLTAQITVSIITPSNYQIADSNLVVKAIVKSTYQLSSVIATAGGRQASLAYNSQSSFFEGSISLAGLVQDTQAVQVIATDILNNQQSASFKVIYDLPPVLIISQPLNFSTARPEIQVKASCVDNTTGCKISVGTLTSIDSINTTLDLSASEGTQVTLQISATDKRNQVRSQLRTVYVESSPFLKERFTAQDKIWDFNYGRLLTGKTDLNFPVGAYTINKISLLKVVNITDSSVSNVPFNGVIPYGITSADVQDQENLSNFVTATGVVFAGSDSLNPQNLNPDKVYQSDNTGLSVISSSILNSPVNNLKVAGNYAIWTQGLSDSLMTRNLSTNTNLGIPQNGYKYGNFNNDVSPDGTVVYWASNVFSPTTLWDIMKYQGGTPTYVTNPAEFKFAEEPLTDGARVIYKQANKCCYDSFSIILYDGAGRVELSKLGSKVPSQRRQYLINQKFVAYARLGSGNEFQLWLRDSSGADRQISFLGSDSKLEGLTTTGETVYYSSGKRFWSDKNGTFMQVGSGNFGKVFSYNNQWYVAIGRTLYNVNLNITPNVINNFSDNAAKDSVYKFTTADFASHFTGDGSLIYIKITQLPANGQLKLNGTPVTPGTVITRSSIGLLTYTPNPGYTGRDSIRWNASNGIQYTTADATGFFNIVAPLAQPVIAGIISNYCSSMPVQKGKLSNPPLAAGGASIKVTIDSVAVTVGTDSTFSFDVSTLSTGTHTLTAIYTNAAGNSSATTSFTITAAVTPDVNVSANSTTIVNTTNLITLTASNASGGGTTPLYTFASDRAFANILQAEGSSATYSVNTTALPMGDNWFYARMKTSATCYTTQSNIDSIKLYKLLVPDQPAVSGALTSYCGSLSAQKIKITNIPAAAYLSATSVTLDGGTSLPLAADSTFSFNPAALAAGNHSVIIAFTNASGARKDTLGFSITPAVTPDVNLSSNISTVVNLTDNVILTASNAAGGGSLPLYTFARDKAISNILQAEGTASTLTLVPNTLAVGSNWFYVRMKTSSSCYTVQTNVDSIKVDRSSITGLVDIDNPGQVITVYPNPFVQTININGLSAARTYLISITNNGGQEVYRRQFSNSSVITIDKTTWLTGNYWLRIYDAKKNRLIGASLLLKE